MRKLVTILVAVLLTTIVFAQSPQKMSYQAVIHNSSGHLIINQLVGMQISILQGSTGGTAVYVETHTPTTNTNGLVSLEIGAGTVVSGNFTTIDWANDTYFIKSETDPNSGTNYTITGTSQLLSVPYALHAKTAETIIGGGDPPHYIGEEYGGGVIFHLWKDNAGVEHGLIVALTDQSSSQYWSNVNILLESSQSLWDGLSNSNAIVAQEGHTSSAAKLCLDLVSGGQNDWYLPSKFEFILLRNNYYSVLRALSQISGANPMSDSFYWSSSTTITNSAWLFDFVTGDFSKVSKINNSHYVRAVRSF